MEFKDVDAKFKAKRDLISKVDAVPNELLSEGDKDHIKSLIMISVTNMVPRMLMLHRKETKRVCVEYDFWEQLLLGERKLKRLDRQDLRTESGLVEVKQPGS